MLNVWTKARAVGFARRDCSIEQNRITMLPYSGLMLDNNYGIVKTETLFGFTPKDAFIKDFNTSKPLEWLLREKMLPDAPEESSRSLKQNQRKPKIKREGKKKCVYKIMNKNKRTRKKNSMQKKYMMPVMLGVMAAKSILVPVALKALAFISAKGLMMGVFSTIMASLLSLKGMFEHSHLQRKDDSKTQVEIIQVPNTDDHYHDNHYHDVQRHDFVPTLM